MTRILYVDDEPDIREVAVMSLELDPDFEVRSANGGAEGVELARAWHPDLILMDVMMPDMDGPTAMVALRDDPATADIPVVFITAQTLPREVERLQALGARGVLSKPFDPMALAGHARDLMG